MYQDDWLLRQVRQAVEALARLGRGEQPSEQEVDRALLEVAGLDLAAIDALPASALVGLVVAGDERTAGRAALLAQLLDAIAVPGDGRADKAAALRRAIGR